jgi:hypothetical protein
LRDAPCRCTKICGRTFPLVVVNGPLRLRQHGMTTRTLGQRCDSTQSGCSTFSGSRVVTFSPRLSLFVRHLKLESLYFRPNFWWKPKGSRISVFCETLPLYHGTFLIVTTAVWLNTSKCSRPHHTNAFVSSLCHGHVRISFNSFRYLHFSFVWSR